MLKKKNILKVLAAIAVGLTLSGCSSVVKKSNSKSVIPQSGKITENSKAIGQSAGLGGITAKEYKELANKKFQNNSYGYENVNDGKSTLNPKAWKTNKVIYSDLDRLNRTSNPNTGFLEKRNLAKDSLRVRQYVQPTGWHYNSRNGEQLYNRGHLIAYSVSAGIDKSGNYNPENESGDQNNPKNLFTQTAYSNQQLQTIYEKKVRTALKQGKKVIYQATAIFRGDEKMARGVNLQAVSTDGTLNFNVYIYNVQNNYKFDYATGSAKRDNSIIVKELPAKLQSHYNDNENSQTSSSYKSYKKWNKAFKKYSKNLKDKYFRKYYRKHYNDYDD